ncbi:MAG: T9SS type A sorting domain-containing protein [Chitinophagaceae bacterium]
MKKALLLGTLCCSISIFSFAQSTIKGIVKGLVKGDSAIVRVQKSGEQYFFKKIGGSASSGDVPFDFNNIPNGKWALSIDAKGYLFPTAKVIEVNNFTSDNTITLTKAPADSNFSYQWQDDSSYVGHAQQAYINDKVEINILGKAEKVPDDFNAINLLNEYGFFLSDSISPWTSEDAYRLYQTVKKFNFQKFGERDSVRVKVVWTITNSFIDKDIDFSTRNNIVFISISRAAFTYASPLVVTVDGVKGKFFSKRLYNALVYYYTDKGTKTHLIDEIAKNRYGIEFLTPSDLLKKLMGETETNFQQFTSEEKLIILSMFEEFPDAMQRQDQLKFMVRRVNGQKHPLYPDAPAIAWVTNQNIEWMESAFKEKSIEYMQRLVLHEKAHFLWEHTFDSTTRKDWSDLGGWFLDATSNSGWSTSNTTEFVSAYAHLKNPNEDMAESIAFFITNPEALRSRSLKKFEFIRDRIMKGTRYISVIRPDLTFTVYNLYPDYNYPGKIKRTKLEVFGKENEDKKVVLEIELTIMNKAFDGADWASCRFISPIGTIKDMGLRPVNQEKSILRGEMMLSKLVKSGYWIVPQITIGDRQGNLRLENNSTYGLKCFINNPLEDITPPLYRENSLRLDSVQAKLLDFTGSLAVDRCGPCADTVKPINAIKVKFDIIEKNKINPDGRTLATIYLPTFDSTNRYNIQPYSFEVQINGNGIKNDFVDSMKQAEFYFPIPDYYPSGWYSVSALTMADQALNYRQVLFDKDTANKTYFIPPSYINQRALRDSIYFKTKYPDMKPPVLDLNDIQIQATPTNPTSPNGETLFEMWLWVKDESDFPGKASGFTHGSYTLRDPQGLEHHYSMQRDLGNLYYEVIPDSSIYGFKRYYFKTLLPIGSPPGLWGVSSITLFDKARNRKYYNFVEIVRFDVEESKVLKVNPYVEILGKKVNMYNADSASVKIGCISCKDQNYRLRMYSSMGGSSVVFEGKMTADTIQLKNLNLKGVNDGVLYATVFILDSSKALIGTGKAIYTKDTKPPTSQKLQTNLANFGKSNLDSLIVQIETDELNGSYNAVLVQTSIVTNSTNPLSYQNVSTFSTNAVGDSILLIGNYTSGKFNFNMSELKNMKDGIITLKFYLKDSLGNTGSVITKEIYKDTKDPVIAISQTTTSGLTSTLTLRTNETIMNTLDSAAIVLKNALYKSITKVDSKTFRLVVDRSCNDTLAIDIKSGSLVDTVGNRNMLTSLSSIETIVPKSPTVKDLDGCQGSAVNLTATPSTGNTLKWYTSSSGGTGSTTPPAVSTTTPGTNSYFVTEVANTGCESQRVQIKVVIKPVPTKPVISWNGSELTVANTYTTYQWLLNNAIVTGANSDRYKPLNPGTYRSIVTNNVACADTSAVFELLVTSASGTMLDVNKIKVFPNPVSNSALIDLGKTPSKPVTAQLIQLDGRLVGKWNLTQRKQDLQLNYVLPGSYILIIYNGKEKKEIKIIKQ